MSLTNFCEDAILALIFRATAWANFADNAVTNPQTQIAIGLHLADPGEAGDMSTNEATYTGYARAAVPRNASGWTTPSTGSISPIADINFPTGTGGAGMVSHFSAGKTGGGAQPIICSGPVVPSIITGNGITPHLTHATVITLE